MAAAPDGQSMIVCENSGNIRRWDLATARSTASFSGWGTAFTYSADGSKFITRDVAGTRTALNAVSFGDANRAGVGEGFDGSFVSALAVAPDGAVARGGGRNEDARLELWDISRSRLRQRLHGHVSSVRAAAFCPTAPLLATGGRDHTVRLWRCSDNTEMDATFFREIFQVAVSNDGSKLAVADADGAIRVLDPMTGKQLARIQRSTRVFDISFSPDGRTLVSASPDAGEGVHLFDAETGQENALLWPPVLGTGLAFSHGGNWLAIGSLGAVRIYDYPSGRYVTEFTGHNNWIRDLVFSSDDQTIASAGYDGIVCLINVADGRVRHRLDGKAARVMGVAFLASDKLVAAAPLTGPVRVWDVSTGDLRASLTPQHNSGLAACSGLAVSRDGRWLAAAYNAGGNNPGGFAIWDASTLELESQPFFDRSICLAICFSANSQNVICGRADGLIVHWNIEDRHKRGAEGSLSIQADPSIVFGSADDATSIAASPDGRLVAVGGYRRVRLYDTAAERLCKTLTGFTESVGGVAFSPDSRLLAAAGSGDPHAGTGVQRRISVWNVATGARVTELESPQVSSMAFSPDGNLLAAGALQLVNGMPPPGGIRVWHTDDWREVDPLLEKITRGVNAIAFSPDGKLLASAVSRSGFDDKETPLIGIWEVNPLRAIAKLQSMAVESSSLAFVDDKTLAALGADQALRVWDIPSAAVSKTVALNADASSITLLRGKGRIAIGFESGEIGLWETAGWSKIGGFKAHQASVVLTDVPQHNALVSASSDGKGNGSVQFWHYATPENIADSRTDASGDERTLGKRHENQVE